LAKSGNYNAHLQIELALRSEGRWESRRLSELFR
jgi:hypothetical protein